MNSKTLGIVGFLLAVGGMLINFASDKVKDKQIDQLIEDKINERFTESQEDDEVIESD